MKFVYCYDFSKKKKSLSGLPWWPRGRVHLLVQETRVRSLVLEDCSRQGAMKSRAPQLWSLSSGAQEPQLLTPRPASPEAREPESLCSTARDATATRSLYTTASEKLSRQGRPSTAKNTYIHKFFKCLSSQTSKTRGFVLHTEVNIWGLLSEFLSIPGRSAIKETACNAGDLGSIPGLGRSPGEGIGYPLQYTGLENSMDCTVHGITKSRTRLNDFHFTFSQFLLS